MNNNSLHFDPTNIIGTDASLNECVSEGYWMLDTEGLQFDQTRSYRLFRYLPSYITGGAPKKCDDTWRSWEDIVTIYNKHKEGLDKFADLSEYMKREPDFYLLLNVADSINAYCGI